MLFHLYTFLMPIDIFLQFGLLSLINYPKMMSNLYMSFFSWDYSGYVFICMCYLTMLLLKNYLEGVLIGIIDIPNCLLFSVVFPTSYYFILQAFSLNFHSPLTFKTIHSSPQPTNGSWSRIRMGLLIQMLCSIIGTAYPRVTLSVEGLYSHINRSWRRHVGERGDHAEGLPTMFFKFWRNLNVYCM
jgi:hypothetical protein